MDCRLQLHGRGLRVVMLFLATTGLSLKAGEEPMELTPMRVGAFCPIVKVGEHQMSEGRKGASVVADGEYLYIVGGANQNSERVTRIERFNVRTRQIEEFARLKVPRAFQNVALVGRRMYIFGGLSVAPGRRTGMVEAHAKAGERAWQRMREDRPVRDAPITRSPPVPAGFSEPYQESVEYLDLDTREQGFAPDMPVPKAFFGTAVHDGKIYVIGGKKMVGMQRANTNTVEIFHQKTQS